MRVRRWMLAGALIGAAHCTAERSAGEQCVFNDDCVTPLVCAAQRCRAQCRTGRDCPAGSVCIPSESPLKLVCVPEREASICGGDGHCPAGALCLDNTCWWTCRDDGLCGSRGADRCQQPPGLCTAPVSARVQSEMPRDFPFIPIFDASVDAQADAASPSTDVVSATDVGNPTDVGNSTDVGNPTDVVTATDVGSPTDVVTATDATAPIDASTAPDSGAADAAVDAPVEAGPVRCMDGADCVLPNATGRCTGGLCAVSSCTSGFSDCNGQPSDGCEVRTASDLANCGRCGLRCATPAHTVVTCASGACVPASCATGYADCDRDPANGCEVDLSSDARHCGACSRGCGAVNVATSACEMARCRIVTCNAGWADCDRTALTSDPASPTPEFANGCETSTVDDAANCGACGVRCDATRGRCASGACVNDATLGWVAAPTSSVRELTLAATPGVNPTVVTIASGTYNLDRLIVPSGVELRVSGTGFLDLRVLGEVRVEGTINLSGGDGGDSEPITAGERRAGGGGGTGTVVPGAPTTAATCSATGGRGGSIGLRGSWAEGDRTCGGPGDLGGGAGGDGNRGGSGGGGFGGGGGSGNVGDGGDGGSSPGPTNGGGGYHVTQRFGRGALSSAASDYDGTHALSCAPPTWPNLAGGGGGGSIGAEAAADTLARSVIATGSGGGGGGAVATSPGGGGGGGGGMLRIVSATRITVSGRLLVEGGRGGNVTPPMAGMSGGGGGGGSGGLMLLVAPLVAVGPSGALSARPGAAGQAAVPSGCAPNGGAGGWGRIVIQTRCATWTRSGSIAPAPRACQAAASVQPVAAAATWVIDYP